jgi:hypothetical protein
METNWKKRLGKDEAKLTSEKKDMLFHRIYTSNMRDVYGKKPTDISARSRAMYELWCDTIGCVDKNAVESLGLYEAYLVNQKLLQVD